VVTFLGVPAGLLVMGGIGKSSIGPEDPRYMSWLARQVISFPRVILVVSIVAAVIAAFGISRLKVENRFIDYFKDDTEIHQGMLVIDNKLGGTMSLDVILNAPENWDDYLSEEIGSSGAFEDDPFAEDFDSFAEDDFGEDPFGEDPFGDESGASSIETAYWWNRSGLRTVERYHDFLEAQPEIGKVTSVATMYKVARDLVGGELNDIELAYMRQSLSPDLRNTLIEPYYDPENQQVRISTRVKESVEGLSRDELIRRVEGFGEEELGMAPENIQVTGLIVLYNNMLQSLFSSQIKTLGAVFVAIMIMFVVLFRSVILSLIALVPNLLAAGIVLGVMGLAGIPLDIMTITIAAITVGMGVDHAIHYITRFGIEFRRSGDYLASIRASHQTIGRALLYTAIIITVGFSVLTLSNFIPSIYFGLLASLAMV
ncbi:MAG: MMPL family transporter, partial [Pseudohongiellaceae bacterium]